MRRVSCLLALALAACGTEPLPEYVPADSPRNRPGNQAPCTSQVVAVTPAPGKVPVARAATIRLDLDGPVDQDAKLVALDALGPVDGEVLVGDTAVEFIPHRLFAQGPVSWEALVCGAHVQGQLEVGALLRPVDDVAVYAGRSFGVDLRGGDWQAPVARDGLDLVLRSLLGGAVVVVVDGAAPDRMTLTVATGALDAAGAITPTHDGTRVQTTVVLKDNPYVPVALPSLTLDVDGRTLRLRDATLVLGLQDGGLADVRLSGEMDARDFGEISGRSACDLLASYSDQVCAPCASDGEPACFPLQLGGLQAP